jgi:hypothetical protein
MNILDFEPLEREGEILPAVFQETERLFFGFYKDYQPSVKDLKVPVDIDTYEGQQAMKDYLEIRVVEEITELREALVEGHPVEHVHEEVGDSFNFLINAYVIYGWGAEEFTSVENLWRDFSHKEKIFNQEEIDVAMMKTVYQVGIACNKLKIRPWKKSQYLTDMFVFEERLRELFYSFINMVFTLGIDAETLWSIFSRKNQCNQFRLDTGY